MRILLDTHALLWYLAGDTQLSAKARNVIKDVENIALVSAASAWEITTKHRLGKLPHDHAGVAADVHGTLVEYGFTELPVSVAHAQRAGAIPGPHKDPFDRMLIAQALVDGISLVSNEEIFDSYGVVRIW